MTIDKVVGRVICKVGVRKGEISLGRNDANRIGRDVVERAEADECSRVGEGRRGQLQSVFTM